MTGAGSFYDPYTLTRNDKFTEVDSKDYYYTTKIGQEAVQQIDNFAKSEKPFFLYVAFTAAHWPLHAPEKTVQKYLKKGIYQQGWEELRKRRYAKMLEMGIINKKTWPLSKAEDRVQDWETIDHKEWRIRNMAVYAAMVDEMDQAVGVIVDELKKKKLFDNTLIVYFHDNGACPEHLGGNGWNTANNILEKAKAKGQTVAVGDKYDVPNGGPLTYGSVGHNWANAQNTPLRRYKMNVHQGGACSPGIFSWPAGLKHKPGTLTNERVHAVDLLATCLELADAEYLAEIADKDTVPHESRSFVPFLKGKSLPKDHPYFFNHAGTVALIKDDYKIVREGREDWALYNLIEDRTETKDLAKQKPELVAEMEKIWMSRWDKNGNIKKRIEEERKKKKQ